MINRRSLFGAIAFVGSLWPFRAPAEPEFVPTKRVIFMIEYDTETGEFLREVSVNNRGVTSDAELSDMMDVAVGILKARDGSSKFFGDPGCQKERPTHSRRHYIVEVPSEPVEFTAMVTFDPDKYILSSARGAIGDGPHSEQKFREYLADEPDVKVDYRSMDRKRRERLKS